MNSENLKLFVESRRDQLRQRTKHPLSIARVQEHSNRDTWLAAWIRRIASLLRLGRKPGRRSSVARKVVGIQGKLSTTEKLTEYVNFNMKASNKRHTENERVHRFDRLHAFEAEKNELVVPQWLKIMYSTVFFSACIAHLDAKRKDLDHFCIDCLQPICMNCLPQHMFHKHVKIRRYVYSDVINRRDLCKLFNCSGIQTYHTNRAKVVFLKQRHQPQQQQKQHNKSREYMCTICYKSLQDNFLYCSVACKVIALHGNECRRKTVCGGHSFEDNNERKGGKTSVEVYTKRPKLRRKGVPLRSPMF